MTETDGTMRAVAYDSYGGFEVLRETRLPRPKVGPGEILIRVRSAGVNPVDWKLMAGVLDPLMHTVFPVVPGWDVAGVVEAVGPDVPEFSPGDEVFAYARRDYVHGGTFAEFVTVAAGAAALKPAALNWDEAAGVPLAGLTARRTLARLGVDGDSVLLIHGAAGGVGVFGAQLARLAGARVIGTASPANHERLAGYGVEPVAYGDGLAGRVRELAPDGVTAVADFVGGVLDTTLAVLADGGRHASIADPTVGTAGGDWIWVRPDGTGLAALAALADQGRLTVPVAEVFPLIEVAEAFRLSQAGHTHGKIIIRVSE
jgi:NADPH:quinone reductase-like Zn-dependent oxidoreductase